MERAAARQGGGARPPEHQDMRLLGPESCRHSVVSTRYEREAEAGF